MDSMYAALRRGAFSYLLDSLFVMIVQHAFPSVELFPRFDAGYPKLCPCEPFRVLPTFRFYERQYAIERFISVPFNSSILAVSLLAPIRFYIPYLHSS